VVIDNVAAAHLAVQHLIEVGRRKIATITGPMVNTLSADRLRGYHAAMVEAVQSEPGWIVDGDFSIESGHAAMLRLLALESARCGVLCQ
jgi:DNA-binding LacI/PurR family transcriptional regulator